MLVRIQYLHLPFCPIFRTGSHQKSVEALSNSFVGLYVNKVPFTALTISLSGIFNVLAQLIGSAMSLIVVHLHQFKKFIVAETFSALGLLFRHWFSCMHSFNLVRVLTLVKFHFALDFYLLRGYPLYWCTQLLRQRQSSYSDVRTLLSKVFGNMENGGHFLISNIFGGNYQKYA